MKSYRYLYGPVPSRRLGRSLGIDLVPHKICTYDCIYCQIGKTTTKTLLRKEYVPIKDVLEEVNIFLQEENLSADYLSLSGSGEPTLHSKIGSLIKDIKEMTVLPLAVITNGSLLWQEEVREGLLQANVVLPSLDAVSPEVFMKINRSHRKLSIEKIIEGLISFRKIYKGKIWLEILFCKGINDNQSELIKMKQAIEQIQPDHIHLNTVVRPPSEQWVAPLNLKEMEEIRNYFGEKATIISEFDRHLFSHEEKRVVDEIVKILRRRPLSLKDLSKGMGISQNELVKHLQPLIQEGKIQIRKFQDSIYYQVK